MFFEFFLHVLNIFTSFWFLIIPFALYYIFYNLWIGNISGKAGANINNIILEIIPPRNVEKSPKIMEKVFDALSMSYSGGDIFKKYINGFIRASFSFEIVASKGLVHYYIVTPDNWRPIIESVFYAQYPEVEIVEVDDYVTDVPAVVPNKEWTIFSADFIKAKHDAYPIKTYKYFQEDITGKMMDPLAPLMETMGTAGFGQYIWLQYIVEAANPSWAGSEGKSAVNAFVGRKSPTKKKSFFSGVWSDILDVLKSIPSGFFGPSKLSSSNNEDKSDDNIDAKLTPGEKQVLTALEENLSKTIFETKMRILVIGKKEGFSKMNFASTVAATAGQFSDNHLNGFKKHGPSTTDANYVFVKSITESRMRKQLIRYRDRDNSGETFKFSSEELATVFHMPDMSVISPSVRFVDSRKGGAPSNLPKM